MNPTKKNIVSGGLVLLGGVMIVLGFVAGPKIMPPPIVTGVGFWLLAWGVR